MGLYRASPGTVEALGDKAAVINLHGPRWW